MVKDKGSKTPSADEIIEALALEMGVDEKPDRKEGRAEAKPSALGKTVGSGREALEAPRAGPALDRSASVSGESALPHIEYGGDPNLDDEHVIDHVFNLSGQETEVDAYVSDYYASEFDDDIDTPAGGGAARGFLQILIILVISAAVVVGAVLLLVPKEYHQDIVPLLSGEDIQAQRRERREREAEEARRQWLASRPKYGSLTVLTRPGFSRVVVDGQPDFVQHPDREAWLVETRSGTTFQNLDIRNHFVLSISLPNYVERRIELYPYDQPNSLWHQRIDDGTYYIEMNEVLEPDPLASTELMARMTPTAGTPDLNGTITVQTRPAGARVFYNNRLLVDENDQPLTTPVTFNTYPPAPPQPLGNGGQPEDATREPIPVTLRATGVPVRVELEGYMPVATGVFRHMYWCQPVEGVAEDAPFWERCNYVYDTGIIELVTPEEFAPPEGTGEGTGQGASAADGTSAG